MPSDLPVVYRAADIGEADIVAAWLDEQGVEAFVKDEHVAVTLATPLAVAPRGISVCVSPQDEALAKSLLEEHREEIRRRHSGTGTLEAMCEECRTVSRFPAPLSGTVQTCPHCKSDMDV